MMLPQTLDEVMQVWAMSSRIIPVLNGLGSNHLKRQYKWVIKIEPEEQGGGGIDPYVIWTTEELERWKGVSRLSWDMWSFPRQRDAEKFQTLYYLTWPQ